MLRIRLIELVRKALDPRDKRFRNHLYIFLICCVISLFIWFLIKMSDEYVAEVSMPVKYDNIPSQKLLVRADNQINIKIRAKGGDIFSVKFLSG
ncbi:MAG TPA: hypothetical protein VK994_01510, partial [Bacteroidales bacterium]|nr:hypothetical protein [Bacteroidales bacterium]